MPRQCNYCGAVFEVHIQTQAGHNEMEEYFCPECDNVYRTRASLTPLVTLITKRTDGKTDKAPSFQSFINSLNLKD